MLYEPILKNNLLRLLEAYTAATGLSEATVGHRFGNDTKLAKRARSERGSFTVALYDRVVCHFAANWPRGHPWPSGIRRPSKRVAAAVLSRKDGTS